MFPRESDMAIAWREALANSIIHGNQILAILHALSAPHPTPGVPPISPLIEQLTRPSS